VYETVVSFLSALSLFNYVFPLNISLFFLQLDAGCLFCYMTLNHSVNNGTKSCCSPIYRKYPLAG